MINDRNSAIQNALFPGGQPGDVSKIEIEILTDGNVRWNLFDGARRIFSGLARPSDQRAMIESTRVIVDTMTAERIEAAAALAKLERN